MKYTLFLWTSNGAHNKMETDVWPELSMWTQIIEVGIGWLTTQEGQADEGKRQFVEKVRGSAVERYAIEIRQ